MSNPSGPHRIDDYAGFPVTHRGHIGRSDTGGTVLVLTRSKPSGGRTELDWNHLVRSIIDKECVPFVGAGACRGLPAGAELARTWAERVGYPYGDRENLPSVMQYAATMHYADAVTLKRSLAREIFSQASLTTDQNDIHHFLARRELPLYLTTNYDDFMFEALKRLGKAVAWNLSPWYTANADDDSSLRPALPAETPTSDRPLVFHLHGHHTLPYSMVLTEDDYVDFHVKYLRERLRDRGLTPGDDRTALVPSYVRARLRRSPLLFLGYGMRDHTFWALFKAITLDMPDGQRSTHACLQLEPRNRKAAVRRYIEARLGRHLIRVFWMTAEQFIRDLDDRLREHA